MTAVSCALLVITPSNKALIVHPTFGRQLGGWSIPKGIADEGEDYITAAIRELHEETGLDVSAHRKNIKPLGQFTYIKGKDIFIATLHFNEEIDIDSLFCDSCFKSTNGQLLPEVDAFKLVDLIELTSYLSVKQADLIKDQFLKNYSAAN